MISASGFVGSAIFRELIERKLTVKAMVRISPALQMNPGTSGKRSAKQPTGFDTPVEDNCNKSGA